MTAYCNKCHEFVEVRGGMFDRYCKACGEPLMSPPPDEPTEIENEEWTGREM